MSLLQRLIPTNLVEEKAKFLADNSYNPQFHYEEPATSEELLKYGLPQKKYLDIAREILDKTYFGRNEADLLMMEGRIQSKEEVDKKIMTFLRMHHLEKRYQIVWSTTFVSRATITKDMIKLRSNSEFREDGLIGMIYHEVGTHALRRINYETQPWFDAKKKNGLTTDYLRTEEGLASLHSLLPKSFLSAYNSAIRYVAVEYAQHHSLSEVWDFLGKYIQDPETRWMITFRQKRGIADTSQPGGFTKDIAYFEGMIETWIWLVKNNFEVPKLYLGKIAAEDVNTALSIGSNTDLLLPSFYTLDTEKYQKKMYQIGVENQLDQFLK